MIWWFLRAVTIFGIAVLTSVAMDVVSLPEKTFEVLDKVTQSDDAYTTEVVSDISSLAEAGTTEAGIITQVIQKIVEKTETIIDDNIDLSLLDSNRMLYINDNKGLGVLGEGESGTYLKSNGADKLPTWEAITASIASTSATFTSVTSYGATYPLTIGAGGPFAVTNEGRLELSYVGDSGYLSSSGGAIFIDNTNNTGTGLGIYSNGGASANGNMINVKVDNSAYAQAAFYMNYDGSSNAVEIVSNSNDSSSNALSVTGNNINDSTVGVIGYELNRGTIKVSHYRPGSANDSSASGLSIDLRGSGTRAQGVYVDSTETGGTLGNLLRLRNESIDKFVVDYQGALTMTGNFTQGANGTNTTFTKYGNVVGDEFFIGTTGGFRVQRSASNSEAFRTQIQGDANGRWVGTSDGRLRWGDGTNATDVTLRRGATGILWLDGGIVLNNLAEAYNTVIKGDNDANLFVVDATQDTIGIGTSTPTAPLHLAKNGGGNAAVIINQLASSQDILTASSSGTTQLRIASDGSIVSAVGAAWRPTIDATSGLVIQNSSGASFVYFDTTNSRVGIGTATPGAPLHVAGGDVWLENNQAYRIKDSAGSARSVLAYTSGNNVQLYNYASTGVVQIGVNSASNTTGNIRFFTNSNTERMRIDPSGVGIGATTFGTNAANVLALASSTAPSTSITDGVQLFAVDIAGSHELQVRDEAGNVTTLSPHNFSLIPDGRSEELAWAFYSERGGAAINADMTKALRLVEALSGEQLIYLQDTQTGAALSAVRAELDVAQLPMISKLAFGKYVSWENQVWQFIAKVVFKTEAIFQAPVHFLAGLKVRGPITVTNQTAGVLVVPAGATRVQLVFESEFPSNPVVYVTPEVGSLVSEYTVAAISRTSFELQLAQPLAQEARFSWLALVQEAGTSQVKVLEQSENKEAVSPIPISIPVPSSTPFSPTPSPMPSPTPSPDLATQGEVAGTASFSAAPAPTPAVTSTASPSASPQAN